MRTIIPKILLSVIIVFVSTSYCFSQVTFLEHTIANNFDGARDVFVIDMDGDDDMDVLAAGDAGGILSWFENDGEEDFEEHEIVDHFSGAYSVHAVDVDGDGDIDVLGAAYIIGTIAWFENDGDMDFTQHNLITNFNVACTVYGVDLDGDDDIDIVSSGRSASLIKWFENDGDEDFTEHNLAQVNDPWNIYVADVNQDDSPDVLSIDYGADETLWFENDGEADFDEHVIEDDIDGPRWVSAADIDLDGDIDIIGAGRSVDLVTWWENDGNEGFTAHTIDDEFDAPNCVFAADVDHDGDIDVFASAYQDNDIKWWENDGDEGFTDHAITLNFSGACNVYSADIDSDDDMDVFGCANTADDITWWESTLDPNANPYPSSVTIHSRIELEGNEELIDDGNIAGLHLNATNGYDENIDLIEPNHPDETYLSTYFPHPEWNELIGDEFRLDIRNANDELTDNLKTYRFIVETDQTGEQVDLTFTIGVGYSNTLGAVLYDVDDDSYQSLRDDSTYSFEAVNLPREFDLVLGDALSPELSIEYPALNQELNTNIEHELAWNITDISPIRNVAVYYSLQGENYTLIDNFNGNPGSLIWDPPDELSHDCRLMIKTFDWAGNATVAIQPFILNPANQPPGEFSLISPINGSVCSTGDTTFTWQSTTDPEGLPVIYEFHKTTDPLFGNNHEILATADTFITISNMPDDERFWWKVRAIDHPGQRTWSNEFWSFDINIPQPPQGPELGWIKHLLSDEFESAEHVYAVDLDGDYDIDVIGLARGSQPDYENSAVTWWENDGVETFTEHILREDFGVGTFVTVADADNDGDVDIFYASYDALVWLENDGNQIFTDHEFDEYNSVVCIDPEDLDRDGDIDLLFCAYDDELIWMENDGDQNYTENVIDNDPGECQWVVVVDLDNDNDIDVLVTRFDQGEDGITWYENTGNEEFTTHSFAEHLQPSCIYALDLDIDGDIDIVASDISTEIVWVENDGNEEFTENYIDRDFRVAWSVFPSDVDNDGNIDVLGASVLDDQINWWGHDGDENFTEHIITDNFDGATSVFAEDVDSDSDIDILGAAQRADEIAWWEQIYPFSLIEPDSGAIVEDETATLSWQSCTDPDPDDIITYEIFWATDSEFSENLDSSSTADTTTEIIGLMDGATYWWTVHAQDTNTEGLWAADTSSFTIDLPEAPESFSLLSPEDGSTIARDFTWLTWEETTQPDEGDSILFYSVWWATDEDFTENLDSTRVAGTTFLLEYLKDDQTYWWKVRAQDSNTDGTWSDETFSFNIEIPHLPRGPAMVFIKHSIAADFGEFMDAYAIDMDDDGDIDVLGVTGNDDDIAWWENDGNQNFTVHTIDDEFEVAYDVYAIDMDIDGDMDVIGAGRDEDEIVWWENDGNQNFTAHTIDDDENTSGYSIYAIDMDEDGDIDVLGATNASDDIFWWENDGNQNFTAHMIVEDFTLSYDVFAIDVDSDNDMDVLGTSLQLDELRWWENDGTEEFTEHSIDDQLNGAWGIYAIDMDEDGDIDLLSAARYDDDVSWWENDGDEEFTEHIIDENFDGAHSVYAVDLDADSDIDVLCTAFDNDEIAWWENDGDEEFTYHQIVNEFEAASSVFAKDIDSDGDSDVLGTTRDDEEIAWWSQDYPFSLTRPANGSIVEDSVVTLAWEECSDPDPDDVLTYEIFWATDSLLSENLDSVSTADTTFGLSDLVEGTTYWWTNHAQDTNTEGLWAADTFSFTFDLSDSPGNFSLISPGDGTTIDRDYLKLQWESTTDPDFEDEIIYVLWWATDEDFTENLDSIRTVGTIYHLENLDDDQNYWWKVRAQDRNTVGIWSDETWTFDVVLPQPPRGPSMVFADYVIRDEFRWPRSVFAIDMDDDRDIDVLGISYFGARIDWCENDGNQNFTEHRIGGAITYGESVYAIDLDSDGDIDVLGCRLHTGYIKWCENDGNQNFTDHLIDDDFDGARSVFASDLDNDGDIDVLGAGYDVEEFAWWENDGNQNFEKHTLGNDFDGASTIYAEDVDDDGDTDILGATHGNDCITWWENDGNQDFTEHTITDEFDGAISVYAIDLDSDDDIDIVGAANNDNDIAWWENDGEQDFTEHIIQDDFTGVHAIYAIDFDGDDDIDVLGTAEEADDVTWWENDGNQNFTRHNIDENFDFAWSVYAKDVDSDGDIDVLGTALGDNNNNITWWSQDYPFSLTGLDSGSIVPGATAILSWQSCTDPDPDDVVTYEIFWATDEELTENLDSVSTADSTYELTGLEDGTQLWWTVHAQDTNTEGLWAADTFSFTVDYPDPPGDFSLLSPEDGSSIPRDFTTLTWEESLEPDEGDSILFYTVYWATDENFTANMDSIRVAGTIYHLEYLRDDQTYWWKVRAQDTNSEGTWSEETWSFDVYIPEPPRGPTLIFTDHTIVDDFDGASSAYATDVDGDGDIDVLGTAWLAGDITWWENDGNENFTEHTIEGDANLPNRVYATDVDGDGDVDVLGTAWNTDAITWWENDGDENFTEHTIDGDFDGATSVYATDVDGDGDVDVLGAAWHANDIIWWENDGSENFTEHTIDGDFNGARTVYATDVDGDGDVDILGAAGQGDCITWWENDGDENFTEHTIEGDFDNAWSVYATDVDGDGDIDVLGAAEDADDITWWENDGNENFTEHTINGDFDRARSVYTIDVDGDGDIDVLGAARGPDDITWWENDGNENFTEYTIDGDFNDANSVYATDIDGDGDIDVLGAAFGDDEIAWWSQDYPFSLTEPDSGSVIEASTTPISWQSCIDPDPDDEITYEIFWATNAEFSENLDSVLTADSTFELTGLADTTTFWWTIHAQDTNTDGLWAADTFSFTTQIPSPPENFSLLSPENGSTTTSFDTILTWETSTENDLLDSVIYYSLWWATDANFTENLDSIRIAGTTYFLNDLPDNSTYYWKVRAQDTNTAGTWSDETFSFEVIIPQVPRGPTLVWKDYLIVENVNNPSDVFAADIDSDGDNDILHVDVRENEIAWWENDGDQEFTRQLITNVFEDTRVVFAYDLDCDGDMDILGASSGDTVISWFENDGDQTFTEHHITEDIGIPRDFYPVDLDGDGDVDLLAASAAEDTDITWIENDGHQNFTINVVEEDFFFARSIHPDDFDDDGDIDILGSHGGGGLEIVLWENNGEETFTEHIFDLEINADPNSLFSADLDGDGDQDFISAHREATSILWWENEGEMEFEEHTVIEEFDGAASVYSVDIDGDGDFDVLGAASVDDE
ncbi:MAG: FG-GAP-like repeat-containing protein, partial [Candidatus Electryonea clarkiae]|nr:FG-GAP-like repeat-containing protein [Candidatus Electryonea clarkiae]